MLPTAADEMTIGTLIHRAADDARELVAAEIELAKTKALARVAGARNAIILIIVAVFLLQAALTTLLVGFALGLEHWLGPVGGAAVVFLTTMVVVAILAKVAIGQLSSGATPEKKA